MRIGNLSKWLFLLSALINGFGWLSFSQAMGQTFTALYDFTAPNGAFTSTNADGLTPYGGLTSSGSTLYGTTASGGAHAGGTLYALNTNGAGFTTLHDFTGSNEGFGQGSKLILSGERLYGTASFGGTNGEGTVYAINTNGTGFTVLHSFSRTRFNTNSDGTGPQGLVLSGNTLYGTAQIGGSSGNGTVFALNTDGTGFTNLYSFTGDNDGSRPNPVIVSGNTLYGTAYGGGVNGAGTVFALNINGTGLAVLHSFATSDGANPGAGLILWSNTLYGTTVVGGSSGNGTVFAVSQSGAGFTNLHSFTTGSGVYPNVTNSDGANPWASLILSGDTLYGTTFSGGTNGSGTVFAVNTNGTGFTTLHAFAAFSSANSTNSGGAWPYAGLSVSGDVLYGTATSGGASDAGTVFSLSPELVSAPQLGVISSTDNLVLGWPTNFIGFTLQTTPNLESPVWTTNSPRPVVVNGQNVVTNPITGTQRFFRLRR